MSLAALREIQKSNGWRAVAVALVKDETPLPGSQDDFGTFWIEAGHRMREQIADDQLLCKVLRHMLPPYHGSALKLYRGENIERWHARELGLSWTTKLEVARMFASGLNAVRTGGVLLEGTFAQNAIISGPNGHSRYLDEEQFTVDPSLAKGVRQLETFPPA